MIFLYRLVYDTCLIDVPWAVRGQMTPGENTFAVFHDNLHLKNSRSQVTAVDPKLFFQMLDICSGNIIFEGY